MITFSQNGYRLQMSDLNFTKTKNGKIHCECSGCVYTGEYSDEWEWMDTQGSGFTALSAFKNMLENSFNELNKIIGKHQEKNQEEEPKKNVFTTSKRT